MKCQRSTQEASGGRWGREGGCWLRNRNKVSIALSDARQPHLVFSSLSVCVYACICVRLSLLPPFCLSWCTVCTSGSWSGSHMVPDRTATARRRSAQTSPTSRSSVQHHPAVGPGTFHLILTQLCANSLFSNVLEICVCTESRRTGETPDLVALQRSHTVLDSGSVFCELVRAMQDWWLDNPSIPFQNQSILTSGSQGSAGVYPSCLKATVCNSTGVQFSAGPHRKTKTNCLAAVHWVGPKCEAAGWVCLGEVEMVARQEFDERG